MARSKPPSMAVLGDLASGALGWRSWARQQLWIRRVQLQAKAARAHLDLEVAPSARISPGAIVEVRTGQHGRLRIGPRCRLLDGSFIHLGGGTVELGPDCELRRGVVLNVQGHLRFEGTNVLGHGTTVHCEEEVVFEPQASCSEYVTVTDSRHVQRDDDSWFYSNSVTAPVRIGRNAWLASKSTVLMGSYVGERSVLACHAVGRGEIPPETLMVGAPARAVRSSIEPTSA